MMNADEMIRDFRLWLLSTIRRRVRNGLLEGVRRGTLHPEEAEALALEKGFAPLCSELPPESFDPMKEAEWSPTMAGVWIAWRDIKKVREHWHEYRAKCWRWEWHNRILPGCDGGGPTKCQGFDLVEGLRTITLLQMKCDHPEIAAAKQELWDKLADNTAGIVASAIEVRTGKPVQIPAFHWPRLDVDEHRGRDVLHFRNNRWEAVYYEVGLGRNDLFRLWPPRKADVVELSSSPEAAPQSTAPIRKARHGPVWSSVDAAVKTLWSDGPPAGLHVQKRNDQITAWQRKHKRAVASDRTIQRYFSEARSAT